MRLIKGSCEIRLGSLVNTDGSQGLALVLLRYCPEQLPLSTAILSGVRVAFLVALERDRGQGAVKVI